MGRVTKQFDPAQIQARADLEADAATNKLAMAATPLTEKTLRDDAAFGILVAIITNQGLAAGIAPLVDSAYQVADEVLKRRTV